MYACAGLYVFNCATMFLKELYWCTYTMKKSDIQNISKNKGFHIDQLLPGEPLLRGQGSENLWQGQSPEVDNLFSH